MANNQPDASGGHDPVDELDLEAIKAREAEATEGPWLVNRPRVTHRIKNRAGLFIMEANQYGIHGGRDNAADAQFIAHARQDIPALIQEVERLRSRVGTPSPSEIKETGKCKDCCHLRPFELAPELNTCPVVNIRIHTDSTAIFGCNQFEPSPPSAGVPPQPSDKAQG